MGTAISCTECSQVNGFIQKHGSRSSDYVNQMACNHIDVHSWFPSNHVHFKNTHLVNCSQKIVVYIYSKQLVMGTGWIHITTAENPFSFWLYSLDDDIVQEVYSHRNNSESQLNGEYSKPSHRASIHSSTQIYVHTMQPWQQDGELCEDLRASDTILSVRLDINDSHSSLQFGTDVRHLLWQAWWSSQCR